MKNKKNKIKSSYKGFAIVSTVFLSIYSLSILFMLGWALLSTFKGRFDFSDNVFRLPQEWIFSNYKTVFENLAVNIRLDHGTRDVLFPELLFNSLALAFGGATMTIVAHVLVAYACAKYPFKYTKFLYAFVIFTIIFPTVNNLPSTMLIVRGLGLYDNYLGILFMKFGFLGTYFLILYATFKSIAWDYAEAAFIDGASNLRVLVSIMIPMASASIGTIFVLSLIAYWNDYMTNVLYMPSMPTISYALFLFRSNPSGEITVPVILTASICLCIPVLALFIAFKNKIIGNLSIGGLKG